MEVAMVAWMALAFAGAPDPGGMAVWKALPGRNTCPEHYDYFPDGGMRIFMCHARVGMSWQALVEHAPVKPFLKGPHTDAALNLDDASRFGHYDPRFVAWLGDFAIPSDPTAVRALQGVYDVNVRPLARTMWQAREALEADPGCRDRELKAYRTAIETGRSTYYYERWYDFLAWRGCAVAPGVDVGDGNVVKTAVAWWLRREMDGTADAWASHLQRLLRTFDGRWLEGAAGPAEAVLRFEGGRHSTVLVGNAVPGQPMRWTFGAQEGQIVTVAVASEHRVSVGVAPKGQRSLVPADQAVWTGKLPASDGSYVLTVTGTGPYELFVGIW